jgi:hypothetical protein
MFESFYILYFEDFENSDQYYYVLALIDLEELSQLT